MFLRGSSARPTKTSSGSSSPRSHSSSGSGLKRSASIGIGTTRIADSGRPAASATARREAAEIVHRTVARRSVARSSSRSPGALAACASLRAGSSPPRRAARSSDSDVLTQQP